MRSEEPTLSDTALQSLIRIIDVEPIRDQPQKEAHVEVLFENGEGLHSSADCFLGHPEAIVGGREFAHVHPDGSLHASLHPETARAAVEAGWATPHPWSDKRAGWDAFVMIYTPVTAAELDVVFQLVQSSYAFVTGR